tara:strand:- start:14629 stop:15072 length:444 start_codon:yes stop_codon:yes gene_type:complete
MKNFSLSLTTKQAFDSQVSKLLSDNPSQGFFVNITKREKKRSASANSVYQTWYPAISDSLALTINEATRYIKFHFGLPILFANQDFGFAMHTGYKVEGFFNLDYADQLIHMDKMPVTRMFTTKMHNKLRDDIQHFFGSQGLALEYEK